MTPGCFSSSAFSSSNVILPLLSSSAASNRASVRSSRSSSLKERELSSIHERKTVLSSSRSIEPDPENKKIITIRSHKKIQNGKVSQLGSNIKFSGKSGNRFKQKSDILIYKIGSPTVYIVDIKQELQFLRRRAFCQHPEPIH